LSKLNWHPVAEIEIRAIEREKWLQELDQRSIEREKRMQQLESEILQVERETEQLKSENARLAELNAKIAALWPSLNSSSAPTAPPEEGSQT
jgi:predicted  nucleic acid-binding Zn-ribbon protein